MQRLAKTLTPSLMAAILVGLAAPALAQDAGQHPLDSTLEVLGLKTTTGPMPDFVTQTRGDRSQDEYLPVGSSAPKRAIAPKSAKDVTALTAELDAARDAQLAGKRPKPMSDGTASAKPKTASGGTKPPKPHGGARQATNHQPCMDKT